MSDLRSEMGRSRTGRRLKILLTEGSSLSARHTLYALGSAGHTIDICDPKPLCIARFSRFVRAWHRCPSFVADPKGYIQFLTDRLRAEHYDVLLPVHDQVYLLSRFRDHFTRLTGLAVPEFAAMEQLQSKASLIRVLDSLKIPFPPTRLARTREELERTCEFPCYIKLAHSTAGCGVWLVRNRDELAEVLTTIEQSGVLDGGTEILVQQPAAGVFCVSQSVFQHGRLIAVHCYQARALGVGGSARARISVSHPIVAEHHRRIGAHLNWHGALNLEYFFDPTTGQPSYVDANPRIGETLNATLSGLNLCELLLSVSLDESIACPPPPKTGVRTHSVVMSLMAVAQRSESRWKVLKELKDAWLNADVYSRSQDELTRPQEDLLSLLPGAVVAIQLLTQPRIAQRIVRRTVDNYALSEAAVRAIRELEIGSSVMQR